MKNKSLLVSLFLGTAILLFSCKKDDKEPEAEPTPTPTPTVTTEFSWKENGGAKIVADSAYWTTGSWGTGIRAFKSGYDNFFEINWDTENNISTGTKVLSVTNYGFTFIKNSITYGIATNQNLSISSSSNDKISGNFTVNVTGGAITTIEGTFTSLSKK